MADHARTRRGTLVGRRGERDILHPLLEGGGARRRRGLGLCGGPGARNTALVDHAIGAASGFRVVRAVGVESESEELPYAALQELCRPMLDRLERLPGPQRDALGAALGLGTGTAPERFMVGLAVLSLLSAT